MPSTSVSIYCINFIVDEKIPMWTNLFFFRRHHSRTWRIHKVHKFVNLIMNLLFPLNDCYVTYVNQIAHQTLEISSFFFSQVFVSLSRICKDIKLSGFRPFSSTKGHIEYANFRGHAFFRQNIEFPRDTRVPAFVWAIKGERERKREKEKGRSR